MTPADWLSCTDPMRMLSFLAEQVSARKGRLFGIACCRRVLDWIRNSPCRRALEMAERIVEGDGDYLVEQAIRSNAEDAAEEAFSRADGAADDAVIGATYSVLALYHRSAQEGARVAAAQAASAAFHAAGVVGQNAAAARAAEHAAQADLLRDLFRPFGLERLSDALFRWNAAAVPALARAIYEERAFDRLPILADALEDAGCTDRAILDHCRGPGPHVRGCWVVDLLLGKG
jgi:hypothetical protein